MSLTLISLLKEHLQEEISPVAARAITVTALLVMIAAGSLLTGELLAAYRVDTRPGPEKVLNFWEDAMAARPADVTALLETAAAHYGEKHYAKALEVLDRVESLSPGSREVYYYRGLIYKATGDKSKAKANFNKVLSSYPNHYLANYQLGILAMEEGQWQSATALLEKSVTFAPAGSPELYYRVGYCYQQRGLINQAREAYQKALKYQPDFGPAKLALTKLP